MKPVIVPATLDHARDIAPRLRLEDALEVRAMGPREPAEVVAYSLSRSFASWVWMLDGRPACIFGIGGSVISNEAWPWLLTTDAVPKHPVTFWRHSREIVRVMSEHHRVLSGYCDARYEATVRWLKRLGFTLTGPLEYGEKRMPFYHFRMES